MPFLTYYECWYSSRWGQLQQVPVLLTSGTAKLLPNRRLSLWYTKANENRVSLNHITVYSTTQSWQQKATMYYLKEVTELFVICLVSILVFFFDITEQLQTDARCDYEQWYGEKYQRTQLLTRPKYLQAQASNQYSLKAFNRVSQRASL